MEHNFTNEEITAFLKESNAIEFEYSEEALADARSAWNALFKQQSVTVVGILRAHKFLMMRLDPTIAGRLRDISVRVGSWVAPDPEDVPGLLAEWVEKMGNVKNEWDIQIAHVGFERIHPFQDGNGRIGRILMNLQRVRAGLPLKIIREADRALYLRQFREEELPLKSDDLEIPDETGGTEDEFEEESGDNL